MTPETRRRIISLSAFVLPLALMKAASTLLGGPSAARAASGPEPIAIAEPGEAPSLTPVAQLTAAQSAALEHVAVLEHRTIGASPLYYEPEDEDPEDRHPVIEDGAPRVTVRAVMSSPDGGAAFIDGEWVRVGATIGESGWMIHSIDARARTVIVVDSTGERTIELRVDSNRE